MILCGKSAESALDMKRGHLTNAWQHRVVSFAGVICDFLDVSGQRGTPVDADVVEIKLPDCGDAKLDVWTKYRNNPDICNVHLMAQGRLTTMLLM
eukprot:jgi/Chrzof1/4654/Cz14g21170.t1